MSQTQDSSRRQAVTAHQAVRKEDVLLHPPRHVYDDPDEPYRTTYLLTEVRYWRGELRAWKPLLARIQRDWQKRNDAAGGTVAPPLPVLEMDPLELSTDYLELLRKKVELGGRQRAVRYFKAGWHFDEYPLLVDHFQSVQRLVEDMRKDRGLMSDQPSSNEEERAPGPSDGPPTTAFGG